MKDKIAYQIPKINIETVDFDFVIGKTILSYILKGVYCTVGHIKYDCEVCIEFRTYCKKTLEMFSIAKFVKSINIAAVEEIPEIINQEIKKIIPKYGLIVTVSLGDENHGGIKYAKSFGDKK